MAGFHLHKRELECDGVKLADIAREVGTPVHVYSAATIRERFAALDDAFAAHPHVVHYALKANSTLAIVRLMRELGACADANSPGEIEVALRAGFVPGDIVCTGVGKSRDELERAISLGVRAINVESPGEVERIDAIASARGVRARVAVRINPDVEAGGHPHISTGHDETKFGMSMAAAHALIHQAVRRPYLHVVGLHVHIGSQIITRDPFERAIAIVAGLAHSLAAEGIALEHIDVGGGLGIAYAPDQKVLTPADYAAAILPGVRSTLLKLVLEPGRWIIAPAGVLLTTVVDQKERTGGGAFTIVDAGMTDLMRPALYGAYHGIEPVSPRKGPLTESDVVGPVCETTDTLGEDRELPPLEVGDVLTIRDTGAYGSVMASNYNRRPMAAEVLVDDGRWTIIRRRQTIDDMLQWDL